MLHELLGTLPPETTGRAIAIAAIAATALGVLLWLAGSRFSRTIITLQLVSIGSSIGMYLPRIMGWRIEGWATALGLALILGATGFFLHRFWVAVGMGLLLATWAGIGTWGMYNNGGSYVPPPLPGINLDDLKNVTNINDLLTQFPIQDYAKVVWASVPGEVQRRLPYATGGAFAIGFAAALIWARLGVILLYSAAGVSILAGLGLYARQIGMVWTNQIPPQPLSQVGILLAMVAAGALMQWFLSPRRAKLSQAPQRTPFVIND